MDAEAKIQAVHDFMKCINRGDFEGAAAFLDPQIELTEPTRMPYAGRYVGPQAFVAMMREIMTHWSTWRDTPYPYELACAGDVVFREHSFRATVRSNGEVVEMRFLEVAEFRGDKIVRIRPYYFDPDVIGRAFEVGAAS